MVFYIQNNDFSSRIASHYESLPSSVVLCILTIDIMTRINSLYGTQTSSVVLCMQNIVISPRITGLQESLTSPVVLCMQNNVISTRKTSLSGSQPSSVVFECKTAPLGPEYQVSMGPYPHLRLLLAKHDFWIRITSLYVSLASPVDLCMKNSLLRSRMTLVYWSQPSFVV